MFAPIAVSLAFRKTCFGVCAAGRLAACTLSTGTATPYQILDVGFGASESEIKKAYRAKVKALHPDVNPSEAAAEQFQAVQNAYEQLTSNKHSNASRLPPSRHGTAYSVEELNQRAERFRRTRMGNSTRVATADNINAAWAFLLAVPIVLMVSLPKFVAPLMSILAALQVVRSMSDPSVRRKDDPNEERVQAWWNPMYVHVYRIRAQRA